MPVTADVQNVVPLDGYKSGPINSDVSHVNIATIMPAQWATAHCCINASSATTALGPILSSFPTSAKTKLIYIIKGVMFVCLSACIYVPYGRPNGWADRDQTWHTHSCPPRECFCQGQCQGHSCMRVGVTELRNTRSAARKRQLANTAQTTSGGWGRRTLTKLRPDDG